MSLKHVVHKLEFEIKGIEKNDEFHKIANRLSAIVRSSLESRLERLLDRYNVRGYHVVIPMIEVDIGHLSKSQFENDLLIQIERRLDRILQNIKRQVEYNIRHNQVDLHISYREENEEFYELLDKRLKSVDGNLGNKNELIKYYASGLISDSAPKVMSGKAQFFESVIHYLEYGWLPRHLTIDEEKFEKIFLDVVLQYDHEVKKYFGRKSPLTKTAVAERIVKKLNIPKLLKSYVEEIKSETRNLQKAIKSVQKPNEKKKLTKIASKKLSKLLTKLDVTSQKIQEYKKLDEIVLEKPAVKDKQKLVEKKQSEGLVDKAPQEKKERMPFLSKKEQNRARIDAILANDKIDFQKLLETPFFKSITKSYQSAIDSPQVLATALLNIFLHPAKKKEVFDQLPLYISTEKELINQIYQKSPSIIQTTFLQIERFQKSPSKRVELLQTFISTLNKKHVNFILKAFISYFQQAAPVLNKINTELAESKETSIHIDLVDENKIIHTEIISRLIDSNPSDIEVILREIIDQYIPDKALKREKIKKISKRDFLPSQKFEAEETFIEQEHESPIELKRTKKKNLLQQFQTLITNFYIPNITNDFQITNVDQLIADLEKELASSEKLVKLQEIDSGKMLTNPVLKNLSVQSFKSIINMSLPTYQARLFLKLYDKYDFIWKNQIDITQVQQVFLSLIPHYKEVTEKTIFGLFFDKLKKYKAWTADIQKKRIITNYELHSDKLNQEERELLINYIDNIATFESMAFKESRKKLESGIPVKNAGLVLLWPFFKTLFQLTGLITKEGDFIDNHARERATLLLQYLAVKSSTAIEPYLALNKVLTGYALDDSITSEIILTEKEKDISEALLLNVIRQWPSFENSSADNLRGSFLIRDGILSFSNNQWVLRVENKAYDLLLNKLPWGYGTIRLSWVPYMIKVEWN